MIMKKAITSCLVLGFNLWVGLFCGQAEQIACGQTINSTLRSAGQTDLYTFDANAGESVTIVALGQSIDVVTEVYSPTGVLIGSCTNNFTGPLALAGAGTHTIRVHAGNSATGAYGISLTSLTGRCGAPFIWGLPATNSLTSVPEVDSYTFSGNPGESVVISASATNFVAAAFVASPSGAILTNWVNGSTTLGLATAGTYTVGIYSYFATGAGNYAATLTFTTLTPASYRLAVGATNRAAVVTLWGEVGRTTTLQYAVDPTSSGWSPLTNFALPWSPFRFVDWDSANSPWRFYRTVQ